MLPVVGILHHFFMETHDMWQFRVDEPESGHVQTATGITKPDALPEVVRHLWKQRIAFVLRRLYVN